MLAVVFVIAIILFALAYRFYGKFLNKHFEIDDNRETPSHSDYDGVDKVPTKTAVLLGHHFSSIAGAGPIVGPIIAAAAFGWVPAILWVIFSIRAVSPLETACLMVSISFLLPSKYSGMRSFKNESIFTFNLNSLGYNNNKGKDYCKAHRKKKLRE